MKRFRVVPVIVSLLAAACAGGCLEKKDYDEIRYYRFVRRHSNGATGGVEEITRKQAATQAHWRFYITDGRAERMEAYNDSVRLASETRVTFDPQGRVIEERVYDPDKRLTTKLVIEYDERGRVSGFKHYTVDAGLREERQWEHDTLGRLKEVRIYGHGGVLIRVDRFVYDKKNPSKLVGVKRYGSQHTLMEEIPAEEYDFWE